MNERTFDRTLAKPLAASAAKIVAAGPKFGKCWSEAVAVLVQKFGGTSVATAERIMAAARRAIRARRAGNQVVVVVSARGDTTDDLLQLAGELSPCPPARELDMLLATGEQVSIALMSMAIQE